MTAGAAGRQGKGVSGSTMSWKTASWKTVALALGCLVLTLPALAREVPYLSGRVVDEADLLSPGQESALTDRLAALEKEVGAQVVVLTIPSLEGENLEDYSLRVAETWQLGRAEEDDGVLLLVARDDRKLRLEVGYGLEPRITDLESKIILDEVVVPRFRQGDFGGGIEAGVDVVARKIRGEEVELPSPGSGGESLEGFERFLFLGIWAVVVIPFLGLSLFGKGCQSWFLFFFLMPFVSLFPGAVFGPAVGVACLAVWAVLFVLVKIFLRSAAGERWRDAHPGWTTWASSGGSFGSGGFSSGGFSGGGGSFGGGGASSSW